MFPGSNALYALLAAGFWGCGDFSGGMGVKRAGGSVGAAFRVILISHSTSFCVLVAIALLRSDPLPHGAPLAWAVVCGVAGALSLTAFYIALSRGAMGAAAAVSGLLAAAIPSCVAMVWDGPPGWRHGAGFLVAGIAIWLIAGGTHKPENESFGTIWLAALAGAGFGVYFMALKFAAPGGLVWPLAAARAASLTTTALMLGVLSATGANAVRMTRAAVTWAASTALFDTTGNFFFMQATRAGRLDVASVLASLYPASTIVLAAGMLKERPTRQQGFGMAVAAVAVVLIAL